MSSQAAAFIDRDGVLNALTPDPETGLPESPLRVDDVRILPGVAAALRALRSAGFLLVCVSNQPAAAKAKVELPALSDVNNAVFEAISTEGVAFDDVRLCFHHPEGTVPGLSGQCRCRKPEPGMLLDAADDLGIDLTRSWVIGDSDSDVEAGRRAGCHTVLVEHLASAHRRSDSVPDRRAVDLAAAVAALLEPASNPTT